MDPVTMKKPGGCHVKFGFRARTASIIGAAAFAALLAGAPSAAADPAAPQPVPAPLPAPVPAEVPVPVPGAEPVLAVAAGSAAPAPAPEGVPHLASPENLPPGTSIAPAQQTRLTYLRDLWHAMQTQEVSGSNALLLLTQRPLSSTPSRGLPAGPQPVAPPAPIAPAAPPAPAPVAP